MEGGVEGWDDRRDDSHQTAGGGWHKVQHNMTHIAATAERGETTEWRRRRPAAERRVNPM